MRTRFLDIDYFASETDSFHYLPVPHLISNQFSTLPDLLHFDFLPEFSLGIDNLTIDSALTKFFHDVLPRRIHDVHNVYRDACDPSSRLQGSTDRIFSSESVETRFLEVKLILLNKCNAMQFDFVSDFHLMLFHCLRLWKFSAHTTLFEVYVSYRASLSRGALFSSISATFKVITDDTLQTS